MSKSGIPVLSHAAKAIQQGMHRLMPKPDMPAPAPVPERSAEPSDPKIKERAATEFATREAAAQKHAVAAGALRSDNEVDLLGAPRTKKRAAARTLLG